MIRKIINVIIIVPLAVIFIVFAVANRHLVTVSFDPVDSVHPALGASMPLFVVILASAALGVIAGGVATWFGQHRWRRAARRLDGEVRHLRAQLDDLRGRLLPPPGQPVPPSAVPPQAPALVGPEPAAGRDKPAATL